MSISSNIARTWSKSKIGTTSKRATFESKPAKVPAKVSLSISSIKYDESTEYGPFVADIFEIKGTCNFELKFQEYPIPFHGFFVVRDGSVVDISHVRSNFMINHEMLESLLLYAFREDGIRFAQELVKHKP